MCLFSILEYGAVNVLFSQFCKMRFKKHILQLVLKSSKQCHYIFF
jgi:hypothetical protein